MTIAAAFLTAEGVVFGADSTTTFTLGPPGPAQTIKFYNSAQKVFQIGLAQNARFGLCTWGDGRVGEMSHRMVAAKLTDKVTDTSTVKEVTDHLISLLDEPSVKAAGGNVGYLIGGVDGVSRAPSCNRVVASGTVPSQVVPFNMEDALFVGAPRFFTRVENGFDAELPALVAKHLKTRLQNPPPDLDNIVAQTIRDAARELPGCGSVSRGLPLREAVDFVHMYLHLTIKAHKFMIGPAVCGGAVEIGFVSLDRPFRWVRHKSFDSAIDEGL